MADTHGKPPEGHTCALSFEDITEAEGNYCEYRTAPSGKWHPCGFASDVVKHLVSSQYQTYIDKVEKASKDCAAAVRRLVVKGPPVYVEDRIAMPLPDGDTHVDMIWYAGENKEVEAKLDGALEGEEREALWNSQRETLAAMEAAEAAVGGAEDKKEDK